MTIAELEETYRQLHERLLLDEIDEESFRTRVDRLSFQDDRGNRWKIGWYTGQWYRYDHGQWVQDEPHRRQAAPAPSAGRPPAKQPGPRRPVATWLTPVLIGLLALAAIALALGWYANHGSDLGGSQGNPMSLAPTATGTAHPPTTAIASPTRTAQATTAQATTAQATTAQATAQATTAQATAQATISQPTAQATAQPTVQATTQVPPAASPTTPTPSAATPPAQSTPTNTPAGVPAASASPAPAARPALSGQIFFPAYDSTRHTFDIYRFDLGGGKKIVVEQASQPALSPDGLRLAYRSWDSEYLGLRVRELADGHTWTWIKFTEAARPSWSPDSQNIVFPSRQEPDRDWRIYRSLGAEFDRVRRHGGDILGRVPTWLSDGRIAYWECPLNQCGIYVMQSDGTSPLRLTTYEHDTTPAGSPDSSQIAFMSDRDGNWEIYVAATHPAADRPALRLTHNAARDGLPTWSPGGDWLAFVSDRGGSWAVWAVRPDGSGLQKLFGLGGSLEGKIAGVTSDNQSGWTWESIAWGRRAPEE